jgi:hypothetical protein
MNIKKFFDDYGYTILKLLGTHVAMSIFGLMVWLPTGNNWLIGSILGVLCVIFYFFMVNNDVAKVGSKDAVRKVYGKPAAHPAKGFIIGAISAIPDMVICWVGLFFWYFREYEWAKATAYIISTIASLWEGMFIGLKGFHISEYILYSAIPFAIILFAGISYILGSKNINLIPLDDNAEDEERKRDAKKEKKKLFSFSKPEKAQDEEDEDELM